MLKRNIAERLSTRDVQAQVLNLKPCQVRPGLKFQNGLDDKSHKQKHDCSIL